MKELFWKISRKLPSFRGKLRIARLLINNYQKVRVIEILDDFQFIIPNLTEVIGFELFVNGVYEKITLEKIIENLPLNSVFVDVGANIGAISVPIAILRPDVRVFAFEPAHFAFSFLNLNKTINNLNNLTTINKAIHPIDNIELPFYSSNNNHGKGSFNPIFTDKVQFVKTVNLDKFLLKHNLNPSLVKVDVEGFELSVFKSMETYLKENNAVRVIFEFVDWCENLSGNNLGSSQQFLIDLNYELKDFKDNIINFPQIKGGNMLIANKINY
jgi:FkbM family methyltransferase